MTSDESSRPDYLAFPLAAAFAAGRALNQLRFHMTQAWLLISLEEASRVNEKWDHLTYVSRSLVPVRQRESIQEAILRIRRAWDLSFDNGAHKETLFESFETASRAIDCGEENAAALDKAAWLSLGEPDELVTTVRSQMQVFCSDRQILAMNLGELIDRGMYPETIYREMYSPQVAPRLEGPGGWEGCLTPRVPATFFPDRLRMITDFPPSHGWVGEILHRCSEMYLDTSAISPEPLSDMDSVRRFVETIDRVLNQQFVAESDSAAESSKAGVALELPTVKFAGHLGITLDDSERLVRRNGVEVILPPLQWEILALLLKGKGKVVDYDILDNAWVNAGKPKPDKKRRSDEVGVLRKSLKGLELDVKPRTKLGYWLKDKEREDTEP